MIDRKRKPRIGCTRTGFTTVELMVVIAIIAVLLAMLMAGIMKVMARQAQSTTQQDLVELAQALENFKTRFHMYPPSSLTGGTGGNVTTVMAKLFPELSAQVGTTPSNYASVLSSRVDNALSPLGLNSSNVNLKGDQCLVLFLGGYHQMSGSVAPGVAVISPQGFSEDPQNPFAPPAAGATGNRIGPYFKFNASRLCVRNPGSDPNSMLASYGDGFYASVFQGAARYNTCYAYFSTSGYLPGGTRNGVGFYTDTDCNSLTDALGGFPKPFINLNSLKQLAGNSVGYEYVNPQSYQIISAGADTLFGTAYKYPASNSKSDMSGSPGTADNFTNFYETRLGES
jgi:prepilin-type N-terminal cleavage/methylation domain-containing protein